MSLLTSWFKSSKSNMEDVKLTNENTTPELNPIQENLEDTLEAATEADEASSEDASEDESEDDSAASLTKALTDNAALMASVKDLQAQVEQLKQSAVSDKRRAALSQVVAEDKVSGLLSSVAGLDDNAFGVVLSSLSDNKNLKKETWAEVGQKATEAVPQDYASTVKAAAAKTINKRKI